jgi:hypothetical protein
LEQKENEQADVSSESSSSGDSSVATGVTYEPNVSKVKARTSRVPLSDIVTTSTIGPDPSVGKSDEIYGQSLRVETAVLKLLCPKGVTPEVSREIMDTAVDVVSLPGKFSATGDSAFEWDGLANVLGDLADIQTRKLGSQPRDTQWNSLSRNALDKIKTIEDIQAAVDEIGSEREKVCQNMNGAIREVLYNAGWTQEDAELYCEAGLLPRIIARTFDFYYALLLNLLAMANRNMDGWEHIGQEHLLHHARQLRIIRRYASKRSQLILHVYVYLRDSHSKGFQDAKLLGAMTVKLQEAVFNASKVAPVAKPLKEWSCNHCHGEFHPGGSAQCPLSGVKTKRARQLSKDITRRLKDDTEAVATVLQEEKERSIP